MSRFIWAAVMCVGAFASSGFAGLDSVVNGGFEEAGEGKMPAGWRAFPAVPVSGASVSVDSAISHSGARSLRISHTNPRAYTRGEQLQVRVKPNTRYLITCWIRTQDIKVSAGGFGARLFIGRDGGLNKTLGAIIPRGTTSNWTRYTYGPVDTGKQRAIGLAAYLHQSTGTVWFDDISVIEVTPDLDKRLKMEIARNILRQDIKALEAVAKHVTPELAQEIKAFAERVEQADDLPIQFKRRTGPPFFALHEQGYKLYARYLAEKYPGQELIVRFVDPFKRQACLAVPARKELTHVHAIHNDTEQVAVNLTNTTQQPMQVALSVNGIQGLADVVWREVVAVEDKAGVLINDALPLAKMNAQQEAIVTVPAGMTRQMWLTLKTRDKAGAAKVTVKLAYGSKAITRELDLSVRNADFPREWPIYTYNYAYLPYWIMTKGRIPEGVADLESHHINAIIMHPWSQRIPWPTFDDKGNLQKDKLDWSTFDKVMAYSTYARKLVIPLDAVLPRVPGAGKFGSKEWNRRVGLWVKALMEGLEQRGWKKEDVFWVIHDEPSGRLANEVVLGAKALHAADKDLKVYTNFYTAASPADAKALANAVDILAPGLGVFKEPAYRKTLLDFQKRPGTKLWAYAVWGKGTRPQDIRSSFTKMFRFGVKGFSFWSYGDSSRGDPWDPYDTARYDFAIIYNGDSGELIPSKRWEAVREGIEDYTLLWMGVDKTKPSEAK